MPPEPTTETLLTDTLNAEGVTLVLQALLDASPDLYVQWNAVRDWVNAHFPDFELYLEDTWNERTEGETHLEYILRSRQTLNETPVLAYDIYLNHRDVRNIWHLDDYQSTIRLMTHPQEIVDFILENRYWNSASKLG